MTDNEQKLLRAVRIMLRWAERNDGITAPFPVYQSFLNGTRWRATLQPAPGRIELTPFTDGETALIATVDSLVLEDYTLDPDYRAVNVQLWLIKIVNYGEFGFVGTEDDAEYMRKYKAHSERSVGTKVRIRAANAEELGMYSIDGAYSVDIDDE